jgi:protein TonB
MKKFLILFLICFIQNIFSQKIKEDPEKSSETGDIVKSEDQVYNAYNVDVMPQFQKGTEFLSAFIRQNYKNPKEGLKGKVYVTFIVKKNGSIGDIKVLRDVGFGTGAEAIRVLKKSPKWIPGKKNNNVVRTLYSLPITVNNSDL